MASIDRMMLMIVGALIFLEVSRAAEEHRCTYGEPCFPDKEQFYALDENLTGYVILESDSEDYWKNIKMWNPRYYAKAGALAMVNTTKDIQKSVIFARKHNLRLSIKSSGHDFLGRSTKNGAFMINLSNIKEVEINLDETKRSDFGEIRVGTGNSWQEIYQKLAGTGRVVVGGSSPTVSPGGYTQGGGHSPLSKKYGLAVHNVLEIEAVLADGSIAKITPDMAIIQHENGTQVTEDGGLFWALRGGGGGTFAIVSYFTYKLHEDTSNVIEIVNSNVLSYTYNGTNTLRYEVLEEINSLITSLPSEYSGYIILNNAHIDYTEELSFDGVVFLSILKFGEWDNETQEVYDSISSINRDDKRFLEVKTYSSFWDYQKNKSKEEFGPAIFQNSLLQPNSFTEKLTDLLMDYLLLGKDRSFISCTHTLLGGAVRTMFEYISTPLNPGWQNALSSLSCGIYVPDTADEIAIVDYGKNFGRRLRELGDGEYLNEPDYYNYNYKEDYWGGNYNKLMEIKKKYDPDNYFTCRFCVGSTMDDIVTAAAPRFTPTYVGLTVLIVAMQVLCQM